jgi:hypothetical protein
MVRRTHSPLYVVSGKQYNVRLAALGGREEQFVGDLLRLVDTIAKGPAA